MLYRNVGPVCLTYMRRLLSTSNKRQLSKVPQEPTWEVISEDQLPPRTRISTEMIEHLERLALVDFGNEAGIERLEDAIRFADQIHLVNTDGVERMDTVLEERSLYLREDVITEGGCRKELLDLAAESEEDYYVAPPGNIPYRKDDAQHSPPGKPNKKS